MARTNPTTERPGMTSNAGWPMPMGPWFDQAMRFTEMWSNFASQLTTAATSFEPDASPPDAARQVRTAMFRAMSQFTEQLMRWPQFLTGMRQSMDTLATMQKQVNDFLTATRHNTQGVARADIDSLLQSLQHLETRLLDRLEELSERVDELSRRIAAAEGNGQARAAEETVERAERTATSRRSTRRQQRDEVARS